MKKSKKAKEYVVLHYPARTVRFSDGGEIEMPPIELRYSSDVFAQLKHAMKVEVIDDALLYAPEHPVNLCLWDSNGPLRKKGDPPPGVRKFYAVEGDRPAVSVGLACSEQALGFLVHKPDGNQIGFVLNREQLIGLRDYLTAQLPRVLAVEEAETTSCQTEAVG
jgi:hypothetical protein